jgi:hypothetical protein
LTSTAPDSLLVTASSTGVPERRCGVHEYQVGREHPGGKGKGRNNGVSASATFTGLQHGEQWRGKQGGEEFLSSREVVWRWKEVLVAKWLERRGTASFYTAPGGARCTAPWRE